MSRRMHSILALVLVALGLTAAACSNATGPQPSQTRADVVCDWVNNPTCSH